MIDGKAPRYSKNSCSIDSLGFRPKAVPNMHGPQRVKNQGCEKNHVKNIYVFGPKHIKKQPNETVVMKEQGDSNQS